MARWTTEVGRIFRVAHVAGVATAAVDGHLSVLRGRVVEPLGGEDGGVVGAACRSDGDMVEWCDESVAIARAT